MIKSDTKNDVINKIKNSLSDKKRESHIVMLEDSVDLVLASDIISKTDIPNITEAAISGYALNHESLFSADYYNEISFDIVDGDEIDLSEAKFVNRGDIIPKGADCVVDIKYVKEKNSVISVNRTLTENSGINLKGSKIKSGEVVLKKDTKLNPFHVGLLASLNEFMVEVYKKVKVGVISFGDNLTTVRTPVKGKDIDLNLYILLKELEKKNVINISYGIANKENSEEILNTAVDECDIVIVLYNDKENYFKAIFDDEERYFDEISISPGEDTFVFSHKDTPVFFLSSDPKSSYLVFNILVKPVIDHLLNIENEIMPYINAKSLYNIPSHKGISEYIPVKISGNNDDYFIEAIEPGTILSEFLRDTGGYILIPRDKDEVKKDEVVKVILV